jgi:hypothetical protein
LQGLTKTRSKRKVHKSTATLLAIPWYSDLLDDQNDEDNDEHGRLLVSSRQSWHTEMAKWIGEARTMELDEDSEDDDTPAPSRVTNWKPVMLATLFRGQNEPLSQSLPTDTEVEAELMQALADEEEQPDDGAIEIDLDDAYNE